MKKIIIIMGLLIITLAPLADKGNSVVDKDTKVKQYYVINGGLRG